MNNLIEETWNREVLIDFLVAIERYEAASLINQHDKGEVTLYRDENTDTLYLEMP